MVNIQSIFVEDIERAFRGIIPQNCINILATMAEENRMLQNAVNDLQKHVEQLKQLMVLSAEVDKALLKSMKRFNDTYADPSQEYVKSQDIKGD